VAGADATSASDVYALGAVFYELLTGRPPYTFGSLADLAAQQADGMIVPVCDLQPAVPPELEAAVMHALAREPRFRPASAAELGQELAGAGDSPTRPLPRRRSVTVAGRSTWLWLGGALVLAALAIALGLAELGGDRNSSPPPPPHVSPPARGATATQQARNLARWLRSNSR
jgi:serine/threonine-protein kinase